MKNRMMYCLLFLSCLFLFFEAGAFSPKILAEKWSISTGGITNRYYRYCAEELQGRLSKRIGKKLPVSYKKKFPAGPVILLDKCDPALTSEGFRIVRKGNVIRIQGGTPLGMLFGVYEFLQRYCDVWELAPGVTYASGGKALMFGDMDISMVPAIRSRRVYHRGWDHTNRATGKKWDDWDVRNRAAFTGRSMFYTFLDPRYLVSRTVAGCHNFYQYVPVAKYGKSHPEYYSLDKDGKRTMQENAGSQLCLSNKDVENIVYDHLLACIAKDRKRWGQHRAPRIYDFSQLDNCNYLCYCAPCRKIIAKYGKTDSGLMIWFINKLARRVKAKYPDVMIRTFAYVNTENPPKGIRVEDNVMIQLCDLYSQCNHMYPLTHPVNVKRKKIVEDWGKIAKNVMIWDYILQDGDVPVVPVDAIIPDTKFFIKNGVKCIFMETEIRDHNPSAFEFLKNFLLAQIYFNPDADLEKLLDVFFKGYYGAAHREMRAYLELLRNAQKADPVYNMYDWHTRKLKHINMPFLLKCKALVEKGMKRNKDPRVAIRLLMERNVLNNGIAGALLAHPERETERRSLVKQLLADRIRVLKTRGLNAGYYNRVASRLRLPLEESLITFTDIPAELKKLPPGVIRFLGISRQHVSGYRNKKYHGQFTKDPESPLPRVMVWIHPDQTKYGKAMGCGTYDVKLKKSTSSSIVPPSDEKYHWYKVGRFTMGPSSYFWALDWQVRFRFDNFFVLADGVKGDENPNVYEIWVCVKFQGPAYRKGSVKPNRIFIDRGMLVSVAKLNAWKAKQGK